MSSSSPRPSGTAARRAARGSAGAAASARTRSGGRSGGGDRRSGADSGSRRNTLRRDLDPDVLAALEEERDFLLASLADLEREYAAGDVDDADYRELKDDYTARAARAIRAVDARAELAASVAPDRSWVRVVATLGVVAILGVGVGWVVFRDAGTRAPGMGLTGDIRQDSANLMLRAQGHTGQAQAALERGDAMAALSEFEAAIATYDEALELSPANVEALTYRGWVLHNIAFRSDPSVGAVLDARALADLDRAITLDPAYADARVFRAILERNAGLFEAAAADLALVDSTAIPPFMRPLVESVRADVAAGLAASVPAP